MSWYVSKILYLPILAYVIMHVWRGCAIVLLFFHVMLYMFSQKLPKKIVESACLHNYDNVGLHIGETGGVTTVAYTTDRDIRIVLGSQGWRE